MTKEDIRKEVGARFREAMKHTNTSAIKLANSLGISHPMIFKMQAGTNTVSFRVLQELKKLHPTISLDYIITGKEGIQTVPQEIPHSIPYQACPICHGSGVVPAPSYTSGVTITCDTCGGNKIIPQHIILE